MKRIKKEPAADSLDAAVARAAESGAKHDTAILQTLREHVWQMLVAGADPEGAIKIIALIISARRQDLAEKNASTDGHQGVTDWIKQNVEPELHVTSTE